MTTEVTIKFPIDAMTPEGEAAIRYLLANGYSTPEQITTVVDNVTLIDNCVLIDEQPWTASDGYAELEYEEGSQEEAAQKYVENGDWGTELNGSVEVSVWEYGINEHGDDERLNVEKFSIDLVSVIDHSHAIRAAMGRDGGCGLSPDDHDWTSEGEGGCDENPGVWSLGGTKIVVKSHCKKCGLKRTEVSVGSQRNPGEGDSVEYEAPDETEGDDDE